MLTMTFKEAYFIIGFNFALLLRYLRLIENNTKAPLKFLKMKGSYDKNILNQKHSKPREKDQLYSTCSPPEVIHSSS